MKTAVLFGGTGTFGSMVARDLAQRGIPLIIVARDLPRTEAFARELGAAHRAVACDVRNFDSCRDALQSAGAENAVAVNCAGPFSHLGPALLEACLDTRSHYCDINDDRAYFARVRGMDAKFKARGLAAVCGCASLPAISGALALAMTSAGEPPAPQLGAPETRPTGARVTLFIGNRNPKGFAAISSAVDSLNRPIAAPQGTLYGYRDGELIPVPKPFGPRKAYNFESPEYDLFPELLGVTSVVVKCGFELRAANLLFNALAHLPRICGARFAKLMFLLGKLAPPIGCSGGAIVTEFFYADGSVRAGSVSSPQHGQRMAVLPCVFVAQELCGNAEVKCGAGTAYEFLGAQTLLAKIRAEGFEVKFQSPEC
ncbi:MAG TPA: SDR family NAD(P)-dependent oxidoreductase [Planctomycetota bacterium]|nr:SDR family NAD(P)-dependent oxidoreductase [Planctomycetota bacterium]